MTRYKTYVLLILCTFLQLFVLSIAQETGTTNISCNYEYNQEYTNDSEFRKNIEKIPSVLNSTQASENTFFNFSIGNETETVNVIALCRGDLILDTTRCRSCLSAAYEELVDKCTKEKESIIWKDECMLRYSDRNIFNIMKTEPRDTDNNDGNATAKNFGKNLRCLLDKLRAAAAAGNSEMKIATGNISVPQGTTFGLVQCTPDLSAQECKDCLGEAFGKLPDCCINKIGGRVVMPSCNVRYETGSAPFYFRTAAQIRGTGECGDGKTNITTIVIVVISTSLVALICMGLYIYYSRKKNQGDIDGWEEISEESLHYDFDAVKSATNNFSPENVLGKGGFGVVYKGRLSDGREIAVKRLLQNATQGELEFKNEILLGDLILNTTRCQSCLSAAYKELLDKCTKEKESIIWKDECMLRYSDRNIFNIMTTEPRYTDKNDGNVTAKNFEKKLRCLFDKLQAAATTAGTSELKLATGNISVPQGTTFGLVQCTPDLTAQECKDCLGEAFGKLPDCCIDRIGGRVVMPSCNVRYETYSAPFYFRTAAQIRGTGECGDSKSNIRAFVIVVIPTSLVALICMGLYIYYSRKKNQGSIDGWEEISEESLHYDFDAVKSATNNFSPENELGKGGFGVVYKVKLGF
ncbi:hypothetical protein ACET3Z_003198 [Daucus carota]